MNWTDGILVMETARWFVDSMEYVPIGKPRTSKSLIWSDVGDKEVLSDL